MTAQALARPAVEQVWTWLDTVADPEIPVISVVDLGIVREVAWEADACVVTITPTYSGCPAMTVIRESIESALAAQGVDQVRVQTQLAPAWTTDWMTPRGKASLTGYGIAPPAQQVIDISGISRKTSPALVVACPHCGSRHTRLVSQFGSTACKALYRCGDCKEPFDYFKAH
ncbi:1,2-phenylacetyl-CoA epoxidase subunit PaaD [Cupriavidus taiwanensis]|uniref:Subunit of multicomponent oxygenase, phenylacetic acid degradation ring-hydroxylating complex protein 4 n=1 Tax=Cupriavidus taiwanensis TaxID=164546 RepID=A0A7Z7JCW5_9BURK|nr:1,2-phenylacetyl-CoA epoxidase subunit PaaD [Cupriavidus taiwanensis]SOY60819.1 subunit of multicomponent oxygenase, phenylacetic acid degradation; ring-hydroxylating complex protein 4 [Cupriavidus taiwanensis]SOZ08366.1 subunit of multicomponent oxygenase, phenylacetic acid degradation; ring-hydroxylating complex protein 4 [Cupriavidus taiwanensis]SOZ13157.1 subunit of multicomponent oxygenase, phenylacetic acid degradation; ring-hydroxylating complex protein 4 [Cupriavidus taiwanensis]SOZ4